MVSERLSYLRGLGGISNRELDRISGLSRGHSWSIERGGRPSVELKTVQAIAAAMGSSVGWLASGEGEPPTEEVVLAAIERAKLRLAGAAE